MNTQLKTLIDITAHEFRRHRRNPVWIISLAAAALLAFSEAFGPGTLDWPTEGQALRAYQLASTMIFGVMTFLLTASTLAPDLDENKRDLLLTRPVNPFVYTFAKYAGASIFALAVNLLLLAACLAIPLFFAQPSVYPPQQFIYVIIFSVLPTILFSASLAITLMYISKKVIIAMPVFLVYFLLFALFRIQTSLRAAEPAVDLWDFSMRLYQHTIWASIGRSSLHDMSFAHLFNPIAPELCTRAVLYTALSLIMVSLSPLRLKRMRTS